MAPYKGRDLTLSQIEEAAAAVTDLYRGRGYMVARAYLPPQDAKDGVITIRVLVGTYGPASQDNKSNVRDWMLAQTLEKNLAPGEPVHKEGLERAVLLVKDMPGADLPKLSIAPGEEPGTAQFLLETPPEKRFGAYFLTDDMGSRYTGRWRFGAGAEVNGLTKLADKLSLFMLTTETKGLDSAMLNYAFGLGGNGLRLDLGYAHVRYELGDVWKDLGATGWSDTFEGTFSYPIVRASDKNIYLTLNLARKNMKDDISFYDMSDRKHSNSAKLGLQREQWTTWGSHPVYTSISGHLTYGNLQLAGDQRYGDQHGGAGAHGSFGYGDINLLTNIGLTEKLALSLSATGQKAFGKNLDSSEQFNATGSGRVRAYRESASGDNGYHLSGELRYTLPSPADKLTHAVGAFVDKGGWETENKWKDWGRNSDNYADVGLAYYLNYGPASLKVELVQAIGAWHEEEMGPESRTSLNTFFILSY